MRIQRTGGEGFEVTAWHGLCAPKDTPCEVVDKIAAALQGLLKDPKVVERFADVGIEPVSRIGHAGGTGAAPPSRDREVEACDREGRRVRRMRPRPVTAPNTVALSPTGDRKMPLPDLLPGFSEQDIEVGEVRIRAAVGGSGPPLLLLHGHPQTHLTWHRVAPALAERFTVVAPDLRGYGDSGKPASTPDHLPYSKRVMARDQVEAMRALGHGRFAVVGHDRGGRVAHRMALDHPGAVERLAVLDIAPTATMYARTDKEFATRYFWWFFLIQPYDMPERLIAGDPEYFLRKQIESQTRTPGSVREDVLQEYLRCYRDPATRQAICEDYRAAATIDLEHDAADAQRKVTAPLLALWGTKGVVGQLYDVLATWREKAADVRGRALDCGHALQEEAPEERLLELLPFLGPTPFRVDPGTA